MENSTVLFDDVTISMHESRLFKAITRKTSIDLHLVNVPFILDGYPSLYHVGDLLTDVRSVRIVCSLPEW